MHQVPSVPRGTATVCTAAVPRQKHRDLWASSYLTVSFAEPAFDCVLPAVSVAYTA